MICHVSAPMIVFKWSARFLFFAWSSLTLQPYFLYRCLYSQYNPSDYSAASTLVSRDCPELSFLQMHPRTASTYVSPPSVVFPEILSVMPRTVVMCAPSTALASQSVIATNSRSHERPRRTQGEHHYLMGLLEARRSYE